MRKVAPDEFFPLLGFLNENGHTPFIVAGQAVNLWARHYAAWDAEFSPLPVKLTHYHPFASEDLEILAGAREKLLEHPAFEQEERNTDPFSKAWSPDESTFYFRVPLGPNERLKIQSMRTINGATNEEIRKRGIEMGTDTTRFFLPDPVTLLQTKIANLEDLDQTNRQDERHVRMTVLCVRAFIGKAVQHGVEGRKILTVVGRLRKLLASPVTKRLSERHGIDFSDALPVDLLKLSDDAKIKEFVSQGLPKLREFQPNPDIQKLQAALANTAATHGVTLPDGSLSTVQSNLSKSMDTMRIQKQGPQSPAAPGGPSELA